MQKSLQYKEHLLNLVRVRRVSLTGINVHYAEREAARGNGADVVIFGGATGTDEAMLSPLKPPTSVLPQKLPDPAC